MRIQKLQLAAWVAAGSLLAAVPALAKDQFQQGQGQAVVTVLPGTEIPGGVPQEALHVKVDGKEANVTGWTQLHSPASEIQVVVLIDSGARTSLGTQMNDIANFIRGLPPEAKVAVAYMEYGRAVLAGPLTTNHAAAARKLRIPLAGMPGVSASPYFCLSDLAKHWPSADAQARREVVMVTNGVDNYEPRYDPDDPYVLAAINDAVRARLIVYSIYWRGQGFFSGYVAYDGESLLAKVAEATGGMSYWVGFGNPVDFAPYFADIDQRIHNQYELDFMVPAGNKPRMEGLKLQVSAPVKFDAPQQVYVHPGAQ